MTDANTDKILEKGKKLGQCFYVVSQAYEEIDALIEALKKLFGEKFTDKWAEGEWKETPEPKKRQGSFYTGYICSAQLKVKDKSYLGFQISLIGSGMNLGENEEPLLHVFKWQCDDKVPDIENIGMGYPSCLEEKSELWGNSLIVWPNDNCLDQWTFSLRLVALTNKAALEERIIQPIEKLLKNPTMKKEGYVEANILGSWDGLVRYNKDKDGQLLSIKAAG